MKILDFALVVGKLKGLKRTGWVRSGIPNPESVADHAHIMKELNQEMKISIIVGCFDKIPFIISC